MSEELFDVVFFGILQAGKDKETVMQNMATLFKTDASKLTPYFAGGRKVIKGKINAAAAEKYKTALENVGLTIKVEPCEATPQSEAGTKNPDTSQAKSKSEQSSKTKIDTSGLSLATVGSDVIENPVAVPAQKIGDIGNISMAEAGADVIKQPVEVPAQKIEDISNLSMAEAGNDVLEQPQQVVPQQIDDISGISMAEPGADLIANPKPKEQAKIPDTSELTLDEEKPNT